MVNNTPWMTRREAAAYVRVSEQTIDAWRKDGLPSTKRGRRVLIDRNDLDEFLRASASLAAEAIHVALAAAPPLTAEQVDRLAALLRPPAAA